MNKPPRSKASARPAPRKSAGAKPTAKGARKAPAKPSAKAPAATSKSSRVARPASAVAGKAVRKKAVGSKAVGSSAGRRKEASAPAKSPPVFPIVGIGASAGGLEALEAFFANVPENPGVAFVVVQHLDPTQKTMLVELLQRVSQLPVEEATDRVSVVPDRVYVIPPNKDLTLAGGRLRLSEPTALRALRLPIDVFLRSLAAARGAQSAGVILSGMGSDGTLGLRAIKEVGGLVLTQDPATARFDSMPRNALNDGVVDVVDAPGELASRLLAILGRGLAREPDADPAHEHRNALERVVTLLLEHCGHDFSLYKKSTAYRRIERRMAIHQIPKIAAYTRFLRENPQELDLLFKELLIGVTSFFRDPTTWETLLTHGFPALFAAHPGGKALRAWVVACSTGEEAYSLAIAFREALDTLKPHARFTLQIFATDLHDDAITRARQASYPGSIAADISPERLARYFVQEGENYRISREIRDMVTFAPQNVILDPPFTKLDLISCRNLMIYFEPELQKRLVPLFHYALNPGGVLILGSAETVGEFTNLFQGFEPNVRVFRRLDVTRRGGIFDFPARAFGSRPGTPDARPAVATAANLQSLADQLLLKSFTPAAVLVSYDGDIVYISGRTGKYLEPAAGRANWNVHAMARPGLRRELAGALLRAVREKADIVVDNVRLDAEAGSPVVRLTVHYVNEPEMMRGMLLLIFSDVVAGPPQDAPKGSRSKRFRELEAALQHAREDGQSSREEMQTSQEELKSTNEELQSTNEELQSSNEELTTSREEMQSMNEELQIVNHELQAKVDDLSLASSDMENLLNSTGIATIFLTPDLDVRRYTSHATRIFKLIPGDAGRPLADLVSDLEYPSLLEDAQRVLDTLQFCETQVATRDGRNYQVRIMPYRTLANGIDGVVITFMRVPTDPNNAGWTDPAG